MPPSFQFPTLMTNSVWNVTLLNTLFAILSQHQDNKWKPIGFILKAFTPTQWNYEIYNWELLAIMVPLLGDFRKHLMTAQQYFEIWTDHANLQYFKKPQKLNRRQA
jgi:hypothetical protein